MTSTVTRLGLAILEREVPLAQAIDLLSVGSSRLVGANGIYQLEAFCATCDWRTNCVVRTS